MPAPAYFLGFDVARDGLGLAIVAGDGSVVATLRRAYAGEDDGTGGSDPNEWWRAARTGVKELLRRAQLKPDQIRCIGTTGDESAVGIDREGKIVSSAVLGADPAMGAALDEVNRLVGLRTQLNLGGTLASTATTVVKLIHLKTEAKRAWHDLHQVLAAKDYLRFRLAGTIATDFTDAASTLLFNPKTRAWSRQLATLLGIDSNLLPPVGPGGALAGRVGEAAARETGLAAGTPVITGCGRDAALALAGGVHQPGAWVVELGGRGSLFLPTAEAQRDATGRTATSCHTVMGVSALSQRGLAGHHGIDWLLSTALTAEAGQARRSGRDPLELVAELAAEVQPGSDGLLYLPQADGATTGAIMGLEQRHGRAHLARAVLEGGPLAIRQAREQLAHLVRGDHQIVAVGPGAAIPLWCQILADVLNKDVQATAAAAESAATGTAILASVAVGVHKSVDEAMAKIIKHRHTCHPRRAAVEAYATVAPRVARLSALLQPAPLTPEAAAPAAG